MTGGPIPKPRPLPKLQGALRFLPFDASLQTFLAIYAALVVAGLCAKGRTEVGGVEYIRRGYENLAGNLASLGARIREVGEPTP